MCVGSHLRHSDHKKERLCLSLVNTDYNFDTPTDAVQKAVQTLTLNFFVIISNQNP